MRQPIQIVVHCVCYSDAGRQYLMLLRIDPPPAESADRRPFWQPVTGGVEGDEAIEATARRELFKETGFRPSAMFRVEPSYTIRIPAEMKRRHRFVVDECPVHVFCARIESLTAPQLDGREHTAYRWCTLDAALALAYWPQDRKSLQQIDLLLSAEARPAEE